MKIRGKANFKKLLSAEGRLVNPFPLFNEKRRCSSDHLQEIVFLCIVHCHERHSERNTRNWDAKGAGAGPEEAQGNGEPILCSAEENEG